MFLFIFEQIIVCDFSRIIKMNFYSNLKISPIGGDLERAYA